MQQLIANWGYLAVLLGAGLEGESVLLLAGIAAQQGYLRLDLVIVVALIGSVAGDQAWFWVGRRYGRRWLQGHDAQRSVVDRVTARIDRWGAWYVLGFRFLWGLRTVSPIALGLSEISARRFTLLNLLAALIWASVVGSLGFLFGQAIFALWRQLPAWPYRLLVALLPLALLAGLQYRFSLRRPPPPPPPAASAEP